jgi:hypothetical protein
LFTGIMLSNVVPAAFDLARPGRYGLVAGSMTLVGGFGGGVATLAAGALRARIDVGSLMSGAALAGSLAALILAATARNHFKEAGVAALLKET